MQAYLPVWQRRKGVSQDSFYKPTKETEILSQLIGAFYQIFIMVYSTDCQKEEKGDSHNNQCGKV